MANSKSVYSHTGMRADQTSASNVSQYGSRKERETRERERERDSAEENMQTYIESPYQTA